MCKVISGFIKRSDDGTEGYSGGGSADINELKQKVAELQEEVAANTVAIGLLENGKAPVFHTHETEDINGFEDALAEYTYAYAEAVITVTLDSDRQVDSIVCVENGAEEELTTFDNFTSKIRTIRLTIHDSNERLVFDGPAFYYSLREGSGVNPLRKQYIQAGDITISRIHGIRAWGAWIYRNLSESKMDSKVFFYSINQITSTGEYECGNNDEAKERLASFLQDAPINKPFICKMNVKHDGIPAYQYPIFCMAIVEPVSQGPYLIKINVGNTCFAAYISEIEDISGSTISEYWTKTTISL